MLGRSLPNRRSAVDYAGSQSVDILYGSMVGTAIVSFAGAVMQWLTMTLLGLPLAIPISILMFFGGFIPYLGSLIVTILGFLVAVAVGSTADIVLMGIFTIVFNIVQGNVVAPLVYGKTVSIHPAVVLLGAPAGAAIAGIVGMVLIIQPSRSSPGRGGRSSTLRRRPEAPPSERPATAASAETASRTAWARDPMPAAGADPRARRGDGGAGARPWRHHADAGRRIHRSALRTGLDPVATRQRLGVGRHRAAMTQAQLTRPGRLRWSPAGGGWSPPHRRGRGPRARRGAEVEAAASR
jgi:hypothetical protein